MKNLNSVKPVNILLVEDNLGDARLAMEALKDSKIINVLNHVEDGEEAMNYLTNKGKYADVDRPDLILLDLNLPKKDGREVLKEIKENDDLKRIPVVILTISKAEEDILKSYNFHANCFITKPIDLNQFMKVVKSIEDFWLTIVKLPNGK
jgi:CheY-like chemotaxis protein